MFGVVKSASKEIIAPDFNMSKMDVQRENFAIDIRSLIYKGDSLDDSPLNGTESSLDMSKLHPCYNTKMNLTFCQSIVSEFQSSDHWLDPGAEVMLIVCYCIVIFIGILGNTTVCYTVTKFKHLQKARNILIINLSVCGILMCIGCMPFSLIRLTLKNWHLGEFMCRLSPSLQTIDVFVSTFTIVAIAVDRYSAIVCATRESSNKTCVYLSIALMWLVSILLCLPMMIFHEVHEVNMDTDAVDGELYKICMEVWPNDLSKKLYTTFVLMFQYILPLTIISILHGRICQFLRLRINGNPRTEREASRNFHELRRQRRNMLLLTAIAVTFALAWLPLTVLNTLADYDYTLFINRNFNHAYAYCLLAAMCSACLNPVIYGWFNNNFRQAFIQMICNREKEVGDKMELATIKNDSRGNSSPPFRFYSSLELQQPSRMGRNGSNKSSKSSNKSRSSIRSSNTHTVSPKVPMRSANQRGRTIKQADALPERGRSIKQADALPERGRSIKQAEALPESPVEKTNS